MDLKLHVVPGEVGTAEEVLVNGEGANLILQSLSQLLTSLGMREGRRRGREGRRRGREGGEEERERRKEERERG